MQNTVQRGPAKRWCAAGPVGGSMLFIVAMAIGLCLDTTSALAQTLSVNGIPPQNGSASVVAGSSVALGITGGTGGRTDWVALYATGAPNSGYIDWWYLNGSKSAPDVGVSSASVTFTAPVTPGEYVFRFLTNGSYTSTASSAVVNVTAVQTASISINNGGGAVSVPPGRTITIGVAGSTSSSDWIALYPVGSPDRCSPACYLFWAYWGNGTGYVRTMPETVGQSYEFRYFSNNTYNRIGTSPPISIALVSSLVVGGTQSGSTQFAPTGGAINVAVSDASGTGDQWLGLFTVGSPNTAALVTQSFTPTDGTVSMNLPSTSALYEFRLFLHSSTSSQILATSGPVRARTVPGGTVSYYVSDPIGSVRAITDSTGHVLEQHDYLPFGEELAPSPAATSLAFGGGERDAEALTATLTATDYFGARYYQSQTGRFTTPDDPTYMDPSDPQSLNGYSYANNNPLRWVDPTGHDADTPGPSICPTDYCESLTVTAPLPPPDYSLMQYLWGNWFQPWGTAAQQVAQPVVNWVTAPRNPSCVGSLMMSGAAAGAAFGAKAGVFGGPDGEAVAIPVGMITGAVHGAVAGVSFCMGSASGGGGGGGGGGFKKPKSGVSGKEGSKDVPNWAKGNRPRVGESGKDFAKRLLDAKYGPGNWKTGPTSEFSQIQKWGDRSFQ